MYYPLNDHTHLHIALDDLLNFLAKLGLHKTPHYYPNMSEWQAYCQNYEPIKVALL